MKTRVTLIDPTPSPEFVDAPEIRRLRERALGYLSAGFAVNFAGPTGCGKTTLALSVAHALGRPIVLLNGNEDLSASGLVGSERGYRRRHVVDNYIRTVTKTEEELTYSYTDERLTAACRHGYTLVYNEFTRSRPEANTPLLSVLAERLLEVRDADGGVAFLPVHNDFRAVFTSNPEEYEGVFRSQDALLDRIVPVRLDYYERETEIRIAERRAQGRLPIEGVAALVDLVRDFRAKGRTSVPSTRSVATLAAVLAHDRARLDERRLADAITDVLSQKLERRSPRELAREVEAAIRERRLTSLLGVHAERATAVDDAAGVTR